MADLKPLRLTARNPEDLTVISACLQDAVTHGNEIGYQARRRRFAAVFSRFRWEDRFGAGAGHLPFRVCTAVHFDSVIGVRSLGIRHEPGELLQLLAIEAEDKACGTEILLAFAGAAAIRLEAECVDCFLTDVGAPWRAQRTPDHGHLRGRQRQRRRQGRVSERGARRGIVLALPRGRILRDVMPLVRRVGIEPEPEFDDPGSRRPAIRYQPRRRAAGARAQLRCRDVRCVRRGGRSESPATTC